jgi:polysaccharide export outer membrane protein
MRIRYQVALYFILPIALTSCSAYKKAIYFQDVDRQKFTKEAITNYKPLTIQPEDILAIGISSMNPESSAALNFASGPASAGAEGPSGYTVDQRGDIQLPVVGNLHVSNLNTSQVREEIRLKLVAYLKEPVVVVKLVNFKISILGDVSNPGLFKIPSERLTIPEAMSLAGDLGTSALRTLLIIRENNGEREFINVDLTKKSVFNSPYYYLKNNDVIYVQPGRIKYSSNDPIYQRIGLILSVVSVAAVFIFK